MTTERRVPIFYNCPSSGPNNNVRVDSCEENNTNSFKEINSLIDQDSINNDISQNSTNNSDQEDSTTSISRENNSDSDQRKPSYVGLSCAVSGYNSYIRYTSPSRKNSPPQQFRVPEPQILDFNNLSDSTNGRALDNMRQEDMNTVGAPVRGQIDHPPHSE